MANGAPAWLIAVPCRQPEGLHDSASHEPRLRDLSIDAKCDLLTLAAVAVASTMLVLVAGGGVLSPARAIASVPLAVQFTAAPAAPSSLVITTRLVRPAARHQDSQSPQPLILASTKPPDDIIASRAVHAVLQIAQADMTAAQPRKNPGALKRVLFGSGQYRVQPFPLFGDQ